MTVITTFLSIIIISKKSVLESHSSEPNVKLQLVPYIQYLLQFSLELVQAFVDSENKINIMNPSFTKKRGFQISKSEVSTKIIDSFRLETYKRVIILFLINDKAKSLQFFRENFLLFNISMDIAVGMLFLISSNVEINFTDQEFY